MINLKESGQLGEILQDGKSISLNPLLQSKKGGGNAGMVEFEKLRMKYPEFTNALAKSNQTDESDVIVTYTSKYFHNELKHFTFKKQIDILQYVVAKVYPMLQKNI